MVSNLRPSVSDLNASSPALIRAAKVLNYVANELGYNPPGAEEGYLFWTAWNFHNSNSILSVEDYSDKALIYRLHSGEWFGDGGLVVAMAWGLALVLMAASGMCGWSSMPEA